MLLSKYINRESHTQMISRLINTSNCSGDDVIKYELYGNWIKLTDLHIL